MRIRLKIDFCEQLLLTLSEFDFARVTHLPFAFSPISPGSISPAAAQTKGRPRLASLRGDHTDRSACYQHRLGCGSCRRRDLPVILPPGRFRLATNPICTGSAIV